MIRRWEPDTGAHATVLSAPSSLPRLPMNWLNWMHLQKGNVFIYMNRLEQNESGYYQPPWDWVYNYMYTYSAYWNEFRDQSTLVPFHLPSVIINILFPLAVIPYPHYPLICVLTLQICFLWTFRINGIGKYVVSCDWLLCLIVLVTQLCLTFCNPMDYSLPGSSLHGISQTRILERVAIPFSRGSSEPRDQTLVSCIAGRFFTI